MSETAAVSMTGGGNGGFLQSTNPLTGLTNTDLRARRRKKRRGVMDTSLQNGSGMMGIRKSLEGFTTPFLESVTDIANSAAENRDELLTKSTQEFIDTVSRTVEEIAGPEPEVLAKGLNHISSFASALLSLESAINRIKSGRSYYDSDSQNEPIGPGIAGALDTYISAGKAVLRMMVNDSVELPDDDEDAMKAEQAGELVKVEGGEFTDDEILVKSQLPEEFTAFLIHPVDLAAELAETARGFRDMALGKVDELLEAEALPIEFAQAYPELFAEDDLGKVAGNPMQTGMGAASGEDDGSDPTDDGSDPTDPNSQDDGAGQDPVEIIARLGAAITAIASSLMQADTGEDPTQTGDNPGDPSGAPDDTALARAEMLRGLAKRGPAPAARTSPEVEDKLAKQASELQESRSEIDLLKSRLKKIESMPAPAKGRVMALGKGQDIDNNVEQSALEKTTSVVEQALTTGDTDRAFHEMVKLSHQAGGRPELER